MGRITAGGEEGSDALRWARSLAEKVL